MAQGLIKSDKTRDGIAAVLARNLGDLEEGMWQLQQDWLAADAKFDGMQAALEQAGLRILNRPNLLRQPEFVSVNVPNGTVVYNKHTVAAEANGGAATTYTITDENITASMVKHQVINGGYEYCATADITVSCSAGSCTVSLPARTAHNAAFDIEIWLCVEQAKTLPYGEISRWYASSQPYLDSWKAAAHRGDEQDEITEDVVTLTGNDIITEADGETYSKAIAFTVTNPPSSGWGNSDRMIWNYGSHGAGATPVALPSSGEYYGDLPLVVGEKYTLSCWARITSGTKAMLWIGVDPQHYWKHPNGYEYHEIEAENGVWQRVTFEFTFNPTGDHFYTYTSNGTSYQGVNWVKTVGIGVCRKYAGTVQLTGFRLVRGKMYICETYDDLDEDLAATKTRVTALEAAVAALGLANGQSF